MQKILLNQSKNLFSTIESVRAAHLYHGQLNGKLLKFEEISSCGLDTLYVFEKGILDCCFNLVGAYVFETRN